MPRGSRTPPRVDNEREILGQRLAADGTEIGTNDFRVSQLGPDGDQRFDNQRPAVAYNSRTCMSARALLAPERQPGCRPLHGLGSASALERVPDDLVQNVRLQERLQVFNARVAIGSE